MLRVEDKRWDGRGLDTAAKTLAPPCLEPDLLLRLLFCESTHSYSDPASQISVTCSQKRPADTGLVLRKSY